MPALVVVCHPRPGSLTARVAERALARFESADLLDLHAEGFDPRMTTADEPDWADPAKPYSPEVHAHFERLLAADPIVVVFPVWWFGLPATLKGWIDRVWNHGLTYGRPVPALAGKRMAWIGLTGYAEDAFVGGGWDKVIDQQLRVGISEFCGIGDVTVRFVHGTVPDSPSPGHVEAVLAAADAALDTALHGFRTAAAP
ncbi:NAD(P)H oxidoreductase [Thermoactinospora rubra]|uniref:NAD(P)H oxidoreductase n=1 Tax=Thermoactinospora rubra TaxID=1088767 RepID=UPI000A1224DE|nr:NAD(P)H oxidoreductase [Thermoactinospora rubra]